ncbi:type II secretion system F family protein [Sulfitobacter sp. MF3-043]|uniref:type II secretion system F family protein n=1 Tax=Sulfitobacter sediminivivens TaxID=3252902 RepID=UPI0036DB1140
MSDLQTIDPTLGLYVVIFIGVLVAYEGLVQLLFRRETQGEARNRRMKMIQNGATTGDVLKLLRDPVMVGGEGRVGPITWVRRLMVQAGLTFNPAWMLVAVFVLAALVFVFAQQFVHQDLALSGGVVVGLITPLVVLLAMKEARLKKLTSQLPDSLDLMARGLKVGHPIAVTVGNVAADMPDPIGTEFGIIQDQINYGEDVATAFHDFAKRVKTEDANYLAVSIGIQHGTGGNLSRILTVLSKVIRDRRTMRKKIKAISAEGRLSAMILTALPLFIYMTIELSSPSFYGDVRNDPRFVYFASAVFGLILVQGLILHKLVSFKF